METVKRVAKILGIVGGGWLVGGIAIFVLWARSGPPLESWHVVDLEHEFRAGRVSEVESFQDYLALEDRLFAELDEKVFAGAPTGPEWTLARYSPGSIADPRGFPRNWNASFELAVAEPRGGVLLLHGMSDSPYSLRALGETLHARGYHVIGLRYPGHGTAPSGLKTATWEDMAAAVALAARHLGQAVGDAPLHIAGYSTGAPLAVGYALSIADGEEGPMPESLLLISPAIAISPAAAGASWLRALSKLPGLERLAWTQVLPEFDPFKYNSFAVNAGDQVHRMTRSLARDIERRAASGAIDPFPRTLVFLSTVDATVTAQAVIDNLLEHLAPDRHELVLFDLNRSEVKTTLLVQDPGPLTQSLMANDRLPFYLTLVGNESRDSTRVVALRKSPFFVEGTLERLGQGWPVGVVSLSHVALPFPPEDPLYGARPPESDAALHLGHIAFQGERGLLKIPADWLLRLRHNPFYDYLERRALGWVDPGAGRAAPR